MDMKRDNDWTEVVRRTLRDAETPPPEDGWERIARSLSAAPSGRRGVRLSLPRIAAAAAAVLLCVVAGELLLRQGHKAPVEQTELVAAADGSVPEIEPILPCAEAPAKEHAGQTAAGQSREAELERKVARVYRSALGEKSAPTAQLLAAKMPDGAASDEHAGEAADLPEAVAAGSGKTESAVSGSPDDGTRTARTRGAEDAAGRSDRSADRSPASDGASRTRSARRGGTQTATSRMRATQDGYGNLRDEYRSEAPRRGKTSFGLFAGGALSGGTRAGAPERLYSDMVIANGAGFGEVNLYRKPDYAECSFRHKQPLSFGLTVRKELPYGLSLESGVVYSLLLSDVSFPDGSEDVRQKLHFLGVPLRLNWSFFERGHFSLYVGAGGMVEKCIAARLGSQSMTESGVQWSVQGIVGAQYTPGRWVGIYFEPEGSYYLTHTALETARTDAPFSLTLRLGVRFSF